MKITRDIIDNGRHIIHINYEKADIEAVRKIMQERAAAKLDAEKPVVQQ